MKTPYDIILRPVVTESSMMMSADKKYTFEVDPRANKTQIKMAVEKIFEGVKVDSVNTLNVKGKPKRQGKFEGHRANWKKAIITLTENSKEITLFEGM